MARRAPPPLPRTSGDPVPRRSALVGAALAGVGLGLALPTPTALLARLVVGPTTSWRDLAVPAAVALAVGVGLLTAGSYDPRPTWAADWTPAVFAVVLSGVATAVSSVALARLLRGPFRPETAVVWWGALAAGPSVLVVGALARGATVREAWSRAGALPPAEGRARRAVSVLVMAGLAAQVGVLGSRRELYPLSPFPMYAEARTADDVAVVGVFEAVTSDGRRVDLGRGIGVATLRDWVEDRDADWLARRGRALVRRHEQRTGEQVATFRVVRREWRVTTHPAPVGLELVDEQVVVDGRT